MNVIWFVLFIVIVILLFVAVIIIYYFNTATVATGCYNDSDCSNGEVCSNGQCITSKQCSTNADCGTNGVCTSGVCTTSTCSTDNQCPIGSSCQRGQCTKTTCSSNTDCNDSSFCVNSVCTQYSCESSYQCPSGYGCSNGSCFQTNIQCSTSKDCFDGLLTCSNGVCNGPGNCPNGWFEFNGFCSPFTNSLFCPSNESVIAGACCPIDEYFNRPCSLNANCGGSNPYCLDGTCRCNKATVPQTYPSYPFATCDRTSSDGCLTGSCKVGYCVPDSYSCVTSSDCNTGYLCKSGTCVQTENTEGAYCISRTDYNTCKNDGRACVNKVCSAKRGTIGDLCETTTDCQTGLTCNTSSDMPYCSL